MIYVQKRGFCLERQKLGLAASHDQVGHFFAHNRQQTRSRGIFDDLGISVHQPFHAIKIFQG